MRNTDRLAHNAFFYAIFAPALIIILFLTTYPIGTILRDSFYEYDFITGSRLFIGFENYSRIIGEELFQRSFQNTVLFTFGASFLEVFLGVLIAFLLYRDFRGKRAASLVIIFPMIISTMVICAIWQIFYHYEIGLFNYLLGILGVAPVGWLTDRQMALFSIILVDIWQWTPFAFLIIQAGMSSIPRELFEAARIDGARSSQIAFKVTLPILSGQILLVLMLRTLDTFRLFDKVYALTGGGPANATQTLSFFIYREGFSFFNFGRASAASVITLFFVSFLALFYVRKLLREDD
ncbi:multiple sugar transport system permease protein [Alkalispirochaeta americana]|uniref:Multiple sugar transport system permease protein n=1 Tax=Alkalispirochaeta americana TaxID=159291 RepID=A0A1N6R8V4_9SPIO|nr:sugar ABC transporter permease [Alkalispirochaeta americana]SIQ25268.1 multiple sugar transport system permease protein [Alkalispirochaeta americana]